MRADVSFMVTFSKDDHLQKYVSVDSYRLCRRRLMSLPTSSMTKEIPSMLGLTPYICE